MYKKYVKRLLSVFFSLILFPFFILLFIVIAPIIIIDDKGPIFYNAMRLGKDGKVFKMFKFRSMKVNAPDIRNNDGTTYNSDNDPRVTRVGKFLRKTSIDEIPQIINILKGEMSFIGPRPDLPDSINVYRQGDEQKLTVRPGLTGYSQAYYRNSSTLEERFDGDVFYANNISFKLDVKIFFKTITTVLKHKNVYRN